MTDSNGNKGDGHGIVLAQPLQVGQLAPAEEVQEGGGLAPVLLRRWRTAVVVWVVVGAAGVAAVWLRFPPKYEVAATVHIAPYVRPILVADHETDISRQYGRYVTTQSRVIVSSAVINAALDVPEVAGLPLIVESADPASAIAKKIDVEPVKGTELLKVSMTGANPRQMVLILNAVLKEYLAHEEDKREARDRMIFQSLRLALADLERKLKSKNSELLRESESAADEEIGADFEAWSTELRRLVMQASMTVAHARAKIATLGADADADADAGPEGGAEPKLPPGLEEYLLADPKLQSLEQQLRETELSELGDERAGRGPDHPHVKGRRQLLRKLQEWIDQREEELRATYASSMRQKLQAEIAVAETAKETLEQELKTVRSELDEVVSSTFSEKARLEYLQHEREQLERSLSQVQQKIWNVEVEQNRTARITIGSPAQAPKKPNIDKRPKYTVAALLLALVMAMGTAFVRDRLDTRFHDPFVVPEKLGVRLLGSIHNVGKSRSIQADLDRDTMEAVRAICTVLLADSRPSGVSSRLITSPTAGNGKSSLALNLARRLAATGREVLLVDGDKKGRSVTRMFEMEDRPGLVELLEGTYAANATVYASDVAQLNILPAGCSHDRFSELLCRRQAQAELRRLFESYEEVIVDSPPLLSGSDALILATLVNDVVLVLRADKSKREEAEAAKERLAGVGKDIIGVVLNGVNPKSARYSYSYGCQYSSSNAYQPSNEPETL